MGQPAVVERASTSLLAHIFRFIPAASSVRSNVNSLGSSCTKNVALSLLCLQLVNIPEKRELPKSQEKLQDQ